MAAQSSFLREVRICPRAGTRGCRDRDCDAVCRRSGSTQLAAGMSPAEFAGLMQRFFQTAIKVFTWTDAIVDKMVGDEVIGIYVPCLTGSDYRHRAVAAGLNLLRATGHADSAGPWLPIGVGVHSGITFMGSIGVEGGNYQFAAL